MTYNLDGMVRLFQVLDFFLGEGDVERAFDSVRILASSATKDRRMQDLPRMSSRLDRLVVPTMGADTLGFERIHASEICAMLAFFFFASSSIL